MDNWLKNNNVVKILSIILAVMLWKVVSLDAPTAPNVSIPIDQIQNAYFYEAKVTPKYNENLFAVRLFSEQVDVTLRGNTNLINQIRSGQNIDKGQFYIDLTEYKAGTYEVPVKYTGFSEQIDVEINPSTIKVTIEDKKRKEMEIIVDKLGKEKEGYQAGEAIIKPRKVHISGTKEQIDQVAFVKASISIDQATNMITQEVPLRALDKNGNPIEVEISPHTAEVQIPVTSPFHIVPLTYKIDQYPGAGYAIKSIVQKTEEVTLYGPKNIVNTFMVYPGPALNLANIVGKTTIQAKVPLVEGLAKVEPSMIEFEVQVVKAETKTFNQVPIKINGIGEGLTATINSPESGISITLEGAPDVLKAVQKDDLEAFVDLTNLPPGEHEVPVQFNVPLLTERINAEQTVIVTIEKE